MTSTEGDFSAWIGRQEATEDDINQATAAAAAATFDQDPTAIRAGAVLPLLWHWFYFLTKAPQSKLGTDGHPQREDGSFMPPITYPRRMFAGARVSWHRPLIIGQPARRETVIRDIVMKSGRSGKLAFVTVGQQIFQEDAVCLEEEQDIVYREPGPPLPAPDELQLPAAPQGSLTRYIVPDPRWLFRFSALTFNAHRIHYDRPYAMREEGYPGLVVHGPLTAILLLQLAQEITARSITSFSFRSRGPLFDLSPFRLVATESEERVEMEAQGPDGKTAMTATADAATANIAKRAT